jgi:hypothetical protein
MQAALAAREGVKFMKEMTSHERILRMFQQRRRPETDRERGQGGWTI